MKAALAACTVSVLALATSCVLGAGAGSTTEPGTAEIDAYVSIAPQGYFLRHIGGPHVRTHILVRPGESPHTFDPGPRQLAELASSKVYFTIGLRFEQRLITKLAGLNPDVRIVDASAGIARRAVEPDSATLRSGTTLPSRGEQTDPHVWLSPRAARVIARNMAEALTEIDPSHADLYASGFEALAAELDSLDRDIARTLEPVSGRSFYVFHPAFGYFADAYGLKQVAAEVGGKEPTAKELATFIRRAHRDGVGVIFVEPQFSQRTARAVAEETGAKLVELDPLAYDYTNNLRRIASEIRASILGETLR